MVMAQYYNRDGPAMKMAFSIQNLPNNLFNIEFLAEDNLYEFIYYITFLIT